MLPLSISEVSDQSYSISLKEGRKVEDYQAISFPLVLNNSDVSSLIESELGAHKKSQWRLFRYTSGSYQ